MMAVNGLVTLIGLAATCFAAYQYDGSMRLIALGLIGIYSAIGFLGSFGFKVAAILEAGFERNSKFLSK